ncbi:heavy-metal-associated domain-containing protein [Kaarinaea lacus]
MIKRIKLKVDDIVCTGCAEDMETVLLNHDGILEANVSFVDDLIDIEYDTDEIDRDAVIKAARGVANLGGVISEQ